MARVKAWLQGNQDRIREEKLEVANVVKSLGKFYCEKKGREGVVTGKSSYLKLMWGQEFFGFFFKMGKLMARMYAEEKYQVKRELLVERKIARVIPWVEEGRRDLLHKQKG